MGLETKKLYHYRKVLEYDEYFRGHGIDIGCGGHKNDSAMDLLTGFDYIESVIPYDRIDGDANTCDNIEDNTYDFVYSSHCLEHMIDAEKAFGNWVRICKPGGYLVHAVPHELFYEKCKWPSRYNKDHKWSWTLEFPSNLPKSIHVPDFLKKFDVDIIRLETVLLEFDFTRFQEDQTREDNGWAASQIEFVLQKR